LPDLKQRKLPLDSNMTDWISTYASQVPASPGALKSRGGTQDRTMDEALERYVSAIHRFKRSEVREQARAAVVGMCRSEQICGDLPPFTR
jgi:hypothetical protein